MLMGTNGRSWVIGEAWSEGGGLDKWSAKESRAGASSMHSERGVVDMLIERMVRGDGVVRMADGCLL